MASSVQIRVRAAVNGRIRAAEIEVLDPDGKLLLTDREDVASIKGRKALAGRLAKKLKGKATARVLEPLIDQAWAEALQNRPAGGHEKKATQAEELVELPPGTELFHSPEGRCYATVDVRLVGEQDLHRETLPVRSGDFRNWLVRRYYLDTGKPPGSKSLQDALGLLEARGRYDGPSRDVHLRIGNGGMLGTVVLDLCSPDWRVAEVTAAGWRVVPAGGEARFRRTRNMLSLPVPVRGGSIDELRPFINIGSDQDPERERRWRLLVAWLLASLRPRGPYPVLILHGEQGSCKSTTARVLRSLVDPNAVPLRSEPKEVRDLMVAASNSWVVALDNLSHLWPWLSDALCCLSTGGGFSARELYSDSDEHAFSAMRPVVLNGIEELASRADLLDRGLVVSLPEMRDYRPEAEFWPAFEQARPRILGALLDAVAGALANVGTVRLAHTPRMADFACWATAAEPALGWEPGAFLEAYTGNRQEANELALESSLIYPHLCRLLEGGAFEGTFSDLKTRLEEVAPESDRKSKYWPQNPRSLSGALRRLAPNLRRVGFEVGLPTGGGRGGRLVHLRCAGGNDRENLRSDRSDRSDRSAQGDTATGGNAGNAGNANSGDFSPPWPDEVAF